MTINGFLLHAQQSSSFRMNLSSFSGINATLLVGIFFGSLLYILCLLIFVLIHQSIVQKRKTMLEAYTLSVDSIIYESQKKGAAGLADPSICDWIQNWSPAQSYVASYGYLQNIVKTDFPDKSTEFSKTYQSYCSTKRRENAFGILLVVITIGAYKLFW